MIDFLIVLATLLVVGLMALMAWLAIILLAALLGRWRSKDDRVSKTTEELELTITEAVKAMPGCEAFVGVIIRHKTPMSRLDANWEIRGIRFGGMDRKMAREALTPIVQRMQQEFRLTED